MFKPFRDLLTIHRKRVLPLDIQHGIFAVKDFVTIRAQPSEHKLDVIGNSR